MFPPSNHRLYNMHSVPDYPQQYPPQLYVHTDIHPSSAETEPPSSVCSDDQDPQYDSYLSYPEWSPQDVVQPEPGWQSTTNHHQINDPDYYADPYVHARAAFPCHANHTTPTADHEELRVANSQYGMTFEHHHLPSDQAHVTSQYYPQQQAHHERDHWYPDPQSNHVYSSEDYPEEHPQPSPSLPAYSYSWDQATYSTTSVESEHPIPAQPHPCKIEQPMFCLDRSSHDHDDGRSSSLENPTMPAPPARFQDAAWRPQDKLHLHAPQPQRGPVSLPLSCREEIHSPPTPCRIPTPLTPGLPTPPIVPSSVPVHAPVPSLSQDVPAFRSPSPLNSLHLPSPVPSSPHRAIHRRSPLQRSPPPSRSPTASPVPIVPSQSHLRQPFRHFHPYSRPLPPPPPVFGLFGSYPLSRGPREAPLPGPTCAPASSSSVLRLMLTPPSKRPSAPLPPPPASTQPTRRPRMACFFCRKRKIACGLGPGAVRSVHGGKDTSGEDGLCNQCARRGLVCERPTVSKRGVRKGKEKEQGAGTAGSSGGQVVSEAHAEAKMTLGDCQADDGHRGKGDFEDDKDGKGTGSPGVSPRAA